MSFAEPIWLYLLPGALIVLALFYAWAERRGQRRLARFAASQLVGALTASYSRPRQIIKMVFIGLAAGLLCVSLARPQYGFVLEESEARGLDILFALDTSRSMLAEDVAPNRLQRAKLAILDLLDDIRGDEVGLIAFAGDAFLLCPLTLDYDAFRQTLATTDTNVIPEGGTDLAEAIEEAAASFTGQESEKLLVLITDGEDLAASGVAAAREAAEKGIRIFTVGVGTNDGEPIPITTPEGQRDYVRDASGRPVRSALDESTLRAIAAATDGLYVPLGASGSGLRTVYDEIRALFPELEQGVRVQQVPLERYQWPLGATILLLLLEPLIGTRRRRSAGGVSLLIAFLLTGLAIALPSPAQASPQAAWDAYQNGNYTEAVALYAEAVETQPEDARLQYNYGNALYRIGQYAAASDAFRAALHTDDPELQSDAFFNLGNALYQLGKDQPETVPGRTTQKALWEESLEAYNNARALEPESNDVPRNLTLVENALDAITDELNVVADPPNGGSVQPEFGRFVHGASVEIEATANDEWLFRRWEGEVAAPKEARTTVTVNGDSEVVAHFVKTWQLDVKSADESAGTAGESGRYPEDEPVTIKAKAKDHYTFKAWEAEGVEIADPHAAETQITLTADASVTATFQDAYLLKVTFEPALGGSAGDTGWYPVNTDVPIHAKPREGFEWVGWFGTGVADPTAAQTSVHLDRNRVVTAEFERAWNLIVAPEKPEAGTTEGSSDEPIGTSVPILAKPNQGYVFDHWEGPGVTDPQAAETSVTIESEKHNVIAIFTPDESQDQNQEGDSSQNQGGGSQDDSSGESKSESEEEQSDPPKPEPGEEEKPKPSEPESQEEEKKQSEEPEQQPGQEEPEEATPEESTEGDESQDDQAQSEAAAQATAGAPGEMTKEQARQLLNALRESGQKLPARRARGDEPSSEGRDW